MGDLIRDLRHALRLALRSPGFTLTAVLTLALGIGAAAIIYGMVDAVLLRPLPFADQERLVSVWGDRKGEKTEASLQDYDGWLQGSRSFSGLAAMTATDVDLALTGRDEPLHVRGRAVSANFFDVLGVEPFRGRTFAPGEDAAGAPAVVVITHGFWRRHFGADPALVGGTISLDGEPHTVLGVLPPDLRFPREVDIFSTLSDVAAVPELRTLRVLQSIGRLAPGSTLEQARQEMAALSARLQREYPRENEGYTAMLIPLVEEILGDTRPALLLLLGAVSLLLLIACANVAGLLLARAAARHKETALRTALGARRVRLVRQLLTESLLLALLAALLGLLFAQAGLELLPSFAPADIPRLDEVSIDGRVLGFTLLASLVTVMLFGLAPALQAARPDLAESLKEGGKGSAGVRGTRLRGLLVVGEVALALVLLVGAGLMIRSFLHLQSTDLGFRPERLLTMRITLGEKRPEPPQWSAFFQELTTRAEALPGVERAAVVLLRPLSGPIGWDYDFTIEGQTPDERQGNPTSNHQRVSPGYFATMGIPLRRGRDFTWADAAGSPLVAIVNESTARRFWPDQDPLGKRLRWGRAESRAPWLTIVGVVGDARYRDLQTVRPDLYVPFLQDPHWAMDLVVRAESDPLAIAQPVQGVIHGIEPDQPVAGLTTMEEAIDRSVARPRLRTLILATFAALALLLSAVGLYGIIAYSVAQRRREIGIRMALGADRRAVLGMVLRQALTLTLAGLAAGLVLAAGVLATGWLSELLFGVRSTDLLTLSIVPLVLIAVALAASLLPALRATRVDPLVALRYE